MSAYERILEWIQTSPSELWASPGKTQTFFSGSATTSPEKRGYIVFVDADGTAHKVTNEDQAISWAKSNNGELLFDTEGLKQASQMLGEAKNQSELSEIQEAKLIDAASTRFALEAKGEVKAFTFDARPDRIFIRCELPSLFKNPKVTSINGISKTELQEINDRSLTYGRPPTEAHQAVNDAISGPGCLQKRMEKYAREAHGELKISSNNGELSSRAFLEKELPALLKNSNISSINEIALLKLERTYEHQLKASRGDAEAALRAVARYIKSKEFPQTVTHSQEQKESQEKSIGPANPSEGTSKGTTQSQSQSHGR